MCRYRPETVGPHLQLKLTDGSEFNYTIGQNFRAPQGLAIANLKFLGRFEEFETLIYLYLETDNFRYERHPPYTQSFNNINFEEL